MEKVKTAFKWMFRDFFTASILIFIAVYFVWFWLALDENFPLGIFFLLLYVIPAAFYAILKTKYWLKIILLIPTVLFWLVNTWFIVISFPSIGEITFHDGTIYILTHTEISHEPQYEGVYLTKWKWGIIPERQDVLRRWMSGEKFVYDEQAKIVGIVRGEILVYLDVNPPLSFQSSVQYGNHLYYMNSECVYSTTGNNSYDCTEYRHTIYQCNLDNASCIMLPMQYIGMEWYGDFETNKVTGELDYIVEHNSNTVPTVYILVYSYGDHPRCYVEGCEILPSP